MEVGGELGGEDRRIRVGAISGRARAAGGHSQRRRNAIMAERSRKRDHGRESTEESYGGIAASCH